MAGQPPSFPASNSAQRAQSGRNKVVLSKGRSLMDWIRLGNSSQDLTGVGGRPKVVTAKELARHNTQEDCWTALSGKVYNLTPYMEYHPGGVKELMKAAGIDGTRIFNEIHKWVNYESMLAKCYVGKLETDTAFAVPSYGNRLTAPRAQSGNFLTPTPSPNTLALPKGAAAKSTRAEPTTAKPRFDFIENDREVVLSIFARAMTGYLDPEHVIISILDWKLKVRLLMKDKMFYQFHMKLTKPVAEDISIKVTKRTGKVDITLHKVEEGTRWSKLGKPLDGHDILIKGEDTDSTLTYWPCKICTKLKVTWDTTIYGLEFPLFHYMQVPIGKHVLVRSRAEGMVISRNYTVVDWLTPEESLDNAEGRLLGDLFLMIKTYKDGVLTPQLDKLAKGNFMNISGMYYGDFDPTCLQLPVKECVMLAAGTGFTPMTRLITLCLALSHIVKVKLIFFNKTAKDIPWKEQLSKLSQLHKERFDVVHVLSQPDTSWSGYRGRVSTNLLRSHVTRPAGEALYTVCGPKPFIQSAQSCLQELKVPNSSVWIFDG